MWASPEGDRRDCVDWSNTGLSTPPLVLFSIPSTGRGAIAWRDWFLGRLPEARPEWGMGLEVPMEVRLLRALEVFSRAMEARDRRPVRDEEGETAVVAGVVGDEGEEEEDDCRSGDPVSSLGFDCQEVWCEYCCDGEWRWC